MTTLHDDDDYPTNLHFWTLDFFLSLLSTHINADGDVEENLRVLALRQLRTWFFFNLVMVLSEWAETIVQDSALRYIRIARCFRLLRCLRVANASRLLLRLPGRHARASFFSYFFLLFHTFSYFFLLFH